ncbi:hypothetical protein ACTVOR_03490 [Serratia nevei]|uniref:hypothetical protein n=1 Tax=Serratia nevei TaxID=2703794 RepID=UPI003FA6C98B
MSDIDCYTIKSSSNLEHGILLKDNGAWIYRKYYTDGRHSPDQKINKNTFTLFKNTRYKDVIDIDPNGVGVRVTIDWASLTLKTSTGLILTLEPNELKF